MSARMAAATSSGDGGDGGELLDLALLHGLDHGGSAGGLNTVHFDVRVQSLDGVSDTGDEPAAANGHDDRVDVRDLFEDLEADGALARNDVFVVERVDEGVAFGVAQFEGFIVSVVVDPGNEADVGAVFLGGFDLGDGSVVRQADEALRAGLRRGKGHTLGMVAGGAGDDAPGLLFVGKLGDLVGGTADLEGTGDLQVLGLEDDFRVRVELRRRDDVGLPDDVFQDKRGMIDLVEGHKTPSFFNNLTLYKRIEQYYSTFFLCFLFPIYWAIYFLVVQYFRKRTRNGRRNFTNAVF